MAMQAGFASFRNSPGSSLSGTSSKSISGKTWRAFQAASNNLSKDPSMQLFDSLGNSPLRVQWKAAIATQSSETDPEEGPSGTGSDGLKFDDSF